MRHLSEFLRIVRACACFALIGSTACSDVSVQPDRPPARALVLQSDGLYCTEADARLSSGAPYQVCVHPDRWNRDLVVFIPGYGDPARTPSLPDLFGETPAVGLFTELGYAFATTGFRGSGLIEPDAWIGGDLLELVGTAKTLLSNTTGRSSRFVYQTGGSQGGLGSVMAVEPPHAGDLVTEEFRVDPEPLRPGSVEGLILDLPGDERGVVAIAKHRILNKRQCRGAEARRRLSVLFARV